MTRRKLRVEHERADQDFQRQLKEAQKAAKGDIELVRAENDRTKQNYERQLEEAQKRAEADAEIVRAEHDRAIQDYQRQLEHVQKTAEANAERVRRRTDAEIADLQNKIEKLEVDLSKVCHYLCFDNLALTWYRQTRIMFRICKLRTMNTQQIKPNKMHA